MIQNSAACLIVWSIKGESSHQCSYLCLCFCIRLTLAYRLVNSLIQVYSPSCSLHSAMEINIFVSVVPRWNKLPSSLITNIQKTIEQNCSRTSNVLQNLYFSLSNTYCMSLKHFFFSYLLWTSLVSQFG